LNIFILDNDPEKSVQYMVDKHVVKMPVETAQILSTALWRLGVIDDGLYKPTHKNHPCCIWAAASYLNFMKAFEIGLNICEEYTYRYRKTHASEEVLSLCAYLVTEQRFPSRPLTPHVQCMPEQYQGPDPVEAYRSYYIGEKQHLAVWSKRPVPEWWRIKTYNI
jgi:hypothetical protein